MAQKLIVLVVACINPWVMLALFVSILITRLYRWRYSLTGPTPAAAMSSWIISALFGVGFYSIIIAVGSDVTKYLTITQAISRVLLFSIATNLLLTDITLITRYRSKK